MKDTGRSQPPLLLCILLSFCRLTAAVSRQEESVFDACPAFARRVLCQGNVFHPADPPPNQTIRYQYRGVSPLCPPYCQVCGPTLKFGDYFRRWEAQYRHCTPDDPSIGDNLWGPGGLDAMFHRILADMKEYRPTIRSSPIKNQGPWILQLEDLLTDAETEAMVNHTNMLIAMARESKEPLLSVVLSEVGNTSVAEEEVEDDGDNCDSTQAWCDNQCLQQQPEFLSVQAKVERLIGHPWKYAEELHLIQYVPGQKYGNHHDYLHEEVEGMTGPRQFTLLFYLNDPVGGGETCFPSVHPPVCVKPKRGRAVLWPQVLNENPEIKDNRTWHEANAIPEGYKYASTVWYHLRDFVYAETLGCAHLDYVDNFEFYQEDDVEDGDDMGDEDLFIDEDTLGDVGQLDQDDDEGYFADDEVLK